MSAFLFVHGIGHGAWCWDAVCDGLTRAGHVTRAVDLPLTDSSSDSAAVQRVLDEMERPVVLVGHSYGGHVISRAGTHPSVSHLVYVTAILLDGDDVVMNRMADFPLSPLNAAAEYVDDMILIGSQAAAGCLYNECDPVAAAAASARLRPTALVCLAVAAESEPWRAIPTTYVLCDRDRAIDPGFQAWMSKRASRVVHLDTDHSPFISRPDELVEILASI